MPEISFQKTLTASDSIFYTDNHCNKLMTENIRAHIWMLSQNILQTLRTLLQRNDPEQGQCFEEPWPTPPWSWLENFSPDSHWILLYFNGQKLNSMNMLLLTSSVNIQYLLRKNKIFGRGRIMGTCLSSLHNVFPALNASIIDEQSIEAFRVNWLGQIAKRSKSQSLRLLSQNTLPKSPDGSPDRSQPPSGSSPARQNYIQLSKAKQGLDFVRIQVLTIC